MLNILASERMKLRRSKLLFACSLLGIVLPILMIAENVYYYHGTQPEDSIVGWASQLSVLCQLIVYPILSGFVITFLIQKEYGDNTIINTLTAPIKRTNFLVAKLIIWFLWHILLTFLYFAVVCIGGFILYGSSQLTEVLLQLAHQIFKTGILNFLTLVPLMFITILQRAAFYPSLLCGCIMTAIGFSGLYWPAFIANSVPWSAVSILSVASDSALHGLPYISIFLCGIIGFALAIYFFRKQEI